MKYVVMSALNQAQEVLLNEDPVFPGISITERYSSEFLDKCIKVADEAEVVMGWLWDEENKAFTNPLISEVLSQPQMVGEGNLIEDTVKPTSNSGLWQRLWGKKSSN